MKKIKIFLLTFFVWHVGYSQNFKWKPTVGSNICLQSISDLGIKGKKGMKPGIDIGIIGELSFKQPFSLEIGFIYVLNKGSLHRLFIYPFPTTLDLPEVIEEYSLNLLKVPINVLLKQKKKNPCFAGAGTVIKYNFSSNRNGKVVGRDETYSDKFTIETKNGQKTGFAILCFFGKEFEIGKQPVSVRINYDTDLSRWRYPTNFQLEKNTYYKMRSHNFSFLFSFIL
jgi:hypothetical protein